MKLSIIIPSKNEVDGIKYVLEGWIKICKDLDYEIIIVDDSDDKTSDIVKRFAERYENINLIYGEKRGVGTARNLGFKQSTGEIILWSDADGNPECLKEKFIETQRKWLLSVLECFDDGSDVIFSPGELWITNSLLANACSIARIDFDISSVAFAYRRSVFKGLPISEGITVGEDMDLFLRALRNSKKKAVSKEPYLFYAPVFNFRGLISSHLWYGKEYLPFLKKHRKRGLINVGGCFMYFGAALLIPFIFLNLYFIFPFIIGYLAEYVRQFKKFEICRRKRLLLAWLFIPLPSYVQRIAFSTGFIIDLSKNLKIPLKFKGTKIT